MATSLSYPTISGVTGAPFISALTDTASIVNAINFLYYGSTDSGTTPRTSFSTSAGIYGMLYNLQSQISSVQAGINVHESAKWATTTTLAAVYTAGGGTAATVSGTIGMPTLTVTSPGFNIAIGQIVTGTGVAGFTVTNVAGSGPYTVTLSSNLTATASGSYTFLDSAGGTGIGATITFSATGVQKIDSTTTDLALNDRVLVKNGVTADSGTASKANGVYYVSTAPAVGVAGILTRALDSDNSIAGEFAEGDFLYVSDGDTNANEAYMLTTSSATGTGPAGTIKIGTDSITYTQFIGVGSHYIGTTATQIASANQALTGISSLAMASAGGGTFTLTPASSASSFAITIPAAADTLIGKATTDVLTNKSLSDTTTFFVDSTDNTKKVNIDVTGTTNITGVLQTAFTTAKTLIFPDVSDTLVARTTTDTLTNKTLTTPTIDVINAASATGTSQTLFGNNTTGTINIGGASFTTGSIILGGSGTGTVQLGGTGTTSSGTINILTGATTSGTKSINIGTNGSTGSTTTITIGTTAGTTPTITLNGAVTLGTTGLVGPATMAAFNTVSTNLSIGGAATTFTLGSTNAGTTTVQAGTTLNLNAPTINGNASTLTLFGTPTTVTAFGSATGLTIGGATTGTSTSTGLVLGNTSTNTTSWTNIATAATTAGTKNINIGTGGTTGSTTTINIGTSAGTPTITLNGTTNIANTFQLGGTAVTTTAAKLNYLTSATGTTGTTSTNVVFSTSPAISGATVGVQTITNTATIAATTDIAFISAAAGYTITLPTPTSGRQLSIVRTDNTANTISITGNIAGVALSANTSYFPASTGNKRLVLVADGSTWYATVNGVVTQ